MYAFVALGFLMLVGSLFADLFDPEPVERPSELRRPDETRPQDMGQALLAKIDALDKSVVLVTEPAQETRLAEAVVAAADPVVSIEEFRTRRRHLHDDFHDLEVRVRAPERQLQREPVRAIA